MALSTQEKLDIASACSVYASNELAGGNRVGGLIDTRLPSLLFAYGQGLEWLYELDPTNADIEPIGNELIAMCKHYAKAENAIVGGGSVPVISPSSSFATAIDWIVSGTASATAPLATGESTVTFDGTGGMPDLRGYNMDFFRGGQPQYTTNPGDGSTYYSWNRVSGVFAISAAANLSEQMRISPIG